VTSRYFFHASRARSQTEGYHDESTETEDEAGDAPSPAPALTMPDRSMSPPPVVKEEVDMDPALADWLKIDDKETHGDDSEAGSVTDPESDDADVADDDDGADDWFGRNRPISEQGSRDNDAHERTVESFMSLFVFPFVDVLYPSGEL